MPHPMFNLKQKIQSGHQSNNQPSVSIIDRGCGTGKTTEIIESFKQGERYLVVVPFLDECDRIIEKTQELYGEGFFVQPEVSSYHGTKGNHLRHLLKTNKNIVTTHELYLSIVMASREGSLQDRHLIIDEVLSVVEAKEGPTSDIWKTFFVDKQYVEVCRETGRIKPTDVWEADVEAVKFDWFYRKAQSGCLYVLDGSFFVWSLPADVLHQAKSTKIYTFLSDGSFMKHWLLKEGVRFTQEPVSIREQHLKDFKAKTRSLLTIDSISRKIENLNYSCSGQRTMRPEQHRRINEALKNLSRRQLSGVPKEDILITSLQSQWFKKPPSSPGATDGTAGVFSKQTGLFKDTNWCSNVTRGTNKYKHCTHAIYLYDQHPHPAISRFLGIDNQESKDDYAICELIQWLYRTCIRDGLPCTLYMPSKRMRAVLEDWLEI